MVGKRVLKKKAKDAVPTIDPQSKKPNKSAIALLIAGAAGALTFWRVVARALAPEGQRARGARNQERDRAFVRLLRLPVERRHRVLGPLLPNALADHPRHP